LVEENFYASSYDNVGSWTNPDNILGGHDDSCASKSTNVAGDYDLILFFDINLPSNAQLEELYHGFHAIKGDYLAGVVFDLQNRFKVGANTSVLSAVLYSGLIPGCDNCGDKESSNLLDFMNVTVNDLNNGNFDYRVRLDLNEDKAVIGLVDFVWLRVVYTVPTVKKKFVKVYQPVGWWKGKTIVVL